MYCPCRNSLRCAPSQALPFFLNGLIADKVAVINAKMVENEVPFPPVEDPTDCIIHVLDQFLDWYNHLRQPSYSAWEVFEISMKTYQLQQALKLVFPCKSGNILCPHCMCVYGDGTVCVSAQYMSTTVTVWIGRRIRCVEVHQVPYLEAHPPAPDTVRLVGERLLSNRGTSSQGVLAHHQEVDQQQGRLGAPDFPHSQKGARTAAHHC
jgi:hypothetical protein